LTQAAITPNEARYEALWQLVANEVIEQMSDLLGARLVTGPIASLTGTWSDLKAQVPVNLTAAQVVLDPERLVRLGLLWAIADSGAPDQWLENDEVRLGLWEAVTSGVVASLHADTGIQFSLIPEIEPVSGPVDAPIGLQDDELGTLYAWEAGGDGVALFFGVVVSHTTVSHLPAQKREQRPYTAKPNMAQMPAGNERVQARAPHLPSIRNEGAGRSRDLDLIMDLPLRLTVEMGSARMLIKDVLALGKGSVVELDKLAGDPVDVLVNGKLLAKGEIVVLPDGNFGVRVVEIISASDRLRNLQAIK
jgi:flagellar motor switch protein FliN